MSVINLLAQESTDLWSKYQKSHKYYLKGCAWWIRKVVLHYSDPLVSYKIGKFIIKIPFSHSLPVYSGVYKTYGRNLIDIIGIVLSTRNFKVIDVGANVGDTVVSIKNKYPNLKVLCFEPNKKFFELLKQNTYGIDDVCIVEAFLGNEDTESKFKFSSRKGTGLLQKSTKTLTKLVTLDTYLKTFPEFSDAKFIKLDTDGFEYFILQGAKKYLTISRPVIFFEYYQKLLKRLMKNADVNILKFLKMCGYRKSIVYDNFGNYLTSLDDIDALWRYVKSRNFHSYYDICIFHKKDDAIFRKCDDYARKKKS